jgi:hypothetical protein
MVMPAIQASCIISSIVIWLLIFVSWQKGPQIWLDHSAKVYSGLLFLIFIIIPIGCLITIGVTFQDESGFAKNQITAIFFVASFSIRPIEFYTLVWKTVIYEAKYYL